MLLCVQRPEVLRQGFLADYVVSQQMFLFFLPAMCVPGPQQVLFRALTNQAYAAGKQLKVMGYSIEDEVCLASRTTIPGIRPLANDATLVCSKKCAHSFVTVAKKQHSAFLYAEDYYSEIC